MRKTNKGNQIDMEALRLKNEKTIAVGNMGVNAKGDKLGRGGVIVQTAKERTKPYNTTNPNAVKQVSIKPDISEKDLASVEDDAPAKKAKTTKPATVDKTTTKTQTETTLENGDIVVGEAGKKEK